MPRKRVTAPLQRRDKPNYAQALHQLRTTTISIRKCAIAHQLPYSTLQRRNKSAVHSTESKPRGRKPVFSCDEEEILKKSLLEFSSRGTPLSRECVKELVQHFVQSLPHERRSKLPFTNGKPGNGFVRNFLRRHRDLSLKRRAQLEKPRQLAMSPTNLAKHYARLGQIYKEFKITHPSQVFNIDESGFSTKTAARSRAKAVFDSKARSNSVELKWSANAQHVTIMPVVSADGRAWNPLAILPGKQAKYRKRTDGTVETPSSFLPPTAHCVYREKAGVDSDIFYSWGLKFVEETRPLRERFRNIVLALDGYGAHCTFRVLQLFKQNQIVVVGLPAHTSHRTQPLDYSVFSPYRTAFRNDLNKCTILVKDDTVNDVYTICELLTNSYNRAVTFQNICSGFSACGLWDQRKAGVNPAVIKATDITNWEGDNSQERAFRTYKELVDSYSATLNLLRSDGDVLVNGTLNTSSGLLLTDASVLTRLEQREQERAEAEKEKQQRACDAEVRRLEKQREQEERQRQKLLAEQEKREFRRWLAEREPRTRLLSSNRAARRAAARLRTSLRVTVAPRMH